LTEQIAESLQLEQDAVIDMFQLAASYLSLTNTVHFQSMLKDASFSCEEDVCKFQKIKVIDLNKAMRLLILLKLGWEVSNALLKRGTIQVNNHQGGNLVERRTSMIVIRSEILALY